MDASSCDVVSTRWSGWHHISWAETHHAVRRLQIRIAKATQLGNWRQAKRLQRLLTRSMSAKAVAVKRVTENQGRKTPGVDGETWSCPRSKWEAVCSLRVRGYRPKPLRRVHIPKPNGDKRPLGIPTMRDRAMQALYLLALEPIAETTGDPNSYGFRPGRSTTDAIVQCSNALNRKHSPQWVLDADIKGCFDNISHEWMIKGLPLEPAILQKWLKAGYVEQGRLFPTEAGTPQGGIISPVLANMVLDGLEALLKESLPRRAKVNFIRYADDFIVTGDSKEILEARVVPLIEAFLAERGLWLSPTKTRIVHVTEGFDFLGWSVKKRNDKLLIVPAKGNKKAFYRKLRSKLRAMAAAPQDEVIKVLNPIIRGWANYHRTQMASRDFAKMDHRIFLALQRWAYRRHPNKGKRWIGKRYFRTTPNRNWVFATSDWELARLSSFTIRRHVKVKAESNPFDPAWEEYFDDRLRRRMLETLAGRRKLQWLLQRQEGLCPRCGQKITRQSGWHIHHRVWRAYGGTDKLTNLELLHPNCHRQLHALVKELPVSSAEEA